MITMQELLKQQRWTRASNYIGEDFSEYITGPGRCRDSDDLVNANFDAALNMLGGESDTVIVESAGHWAVGWVEQILVHESDEEKLKILLNIANALEDYPILDEDLFYEYENESREDTWNNNSSFIIQDTLKLLKINSSDDHGFDEDELEKLVHAIYEYDCSYRGVEDGWTATDAKQLIEHLESIEYAFESPLIPAFKWRAHMVQRWPYL